jgi:hypothetical protein
VTDFFRAPLVVLVLLWGCGDDAKSPSCRPDEERPSCDPLYAPTFDQLFQRRLKPTCAAAGGSCHASEGAQGGLVLEDADQAFEGLQMRVAPGNPSCSLLMDRLDATGALVMPPGDPLSESERCAFRLWIYDGASR